VLAVDGRPDASPSDPMHVYWLPFVCVNPPNDAYYACFQGLESSGAEMSQAGVGVDGGGAATITFAISGWDGGVEAGVTGGLAPSGGIGGLLKSIPTGTDLGRFLISGSRAVFSLPSDIISSHPTVKGASFPYGLAVVFNIACAGHVELLPSDPSNLDPEQIPFGCFNAQEQQLSPNDYVIGYTEVFAYDTLTNQNPVIQSFAFRDASVTIDAGVEAGVTFPYCTDSKTSKCPDNNAVLGVPDASWERDPQDLGADGGPVGEQIWVDYFTTIGSVSDDAILVFDPVAGRVTPKNPESLLVTQKQRGTLWAVLHDNRGGAAWITVGLNAD
jgi:hypothetical protein